MASAISSAIELGGKAGCAAIMNGTFTALVIGAKSLTASYGSFGLTCGLIYIVVAVVSSSVYPSGSDFATASAPMIVLAPPRLSMTTC